MQCAAVVNGLGERGKMVSVAFRSYAVPYYWALCMLIRWKGYLVRHEEALHRPFTIVDVRMVRVELKLDEEDTRTTDIWWNGRRICLCRRAE